LLPPSPPPPPLHMHHLAFTAVVLVSTVDGRAKHNHHHAPMCKYVDPHRNGPYDPEKPLAFSSLPCGTKFTSDERHPDFLSAFHGEDCIEYRVRSDADVSVCFATIEEWARYGDEVTLHPRLCPCTSAKRCRMMNSELGGNASAMLFITPDESSIVRLDVRARRCSDANDVVLSAVAHIKDETVDSFGIFKRRQFAAAVAAAVDVGSEDCDIVDVLQETPTRIGVELELSLVSERAMAQAVERLASSGFAAEVIAEMSEDGYYHITGLDPSDIAFKVIRVDAPQTMPWFDVGLGAVTVFSFMGAYALYRMYKDGVLSSRRARQRRERARDDDEAVGSGLLGDADGGGGGRGGSAELTRRSPSWTGSSSERAGFAGAARKASYKSRRTGGGRHPEDDGIRRRSSAKQDDL